MHISAELYKGNDEKIVHHMKVVQNKLNNYIHRSLLSASKHFSVFRMFRKGSFKKELFNLVQLEYYGGIIGEMLDGHERHSLYHLYDRNASYSEYDSQLEAKRFLERLSVYSNVIRVHIDKDEEQRLLKYVDVDVYDMVMDRLTILKSAFEHVGIIDNTSNLYASALHIDHSESDASWHNYSSKRLRNHRIPRDRDNERYRYSPNIFTTDRDRKAQWKNPYSDYRKIFSFKPMNEKLKGLVRQRTASIVKEIREEMLNRSIISASYKYAIKDVDSTFKEEALKRSTQIKLHEISRKNIETRIEESKEKIEKLKESIEEMEIVKIEKDNEINQVLSQISEVVDNKLVEKICYSETIEVTDDMYENYVGRETVKSLPEEVLKKYLIEYLRSSFESHFRYSKVCSSNRMTVRHLIELISK